MKRIYLLCIAIFGLYLCSMATPVDLQTAQSVATKFMGTNDLQLAATYRTESNVAVFYVFNTTDGFVIVSADDCEMPIIGYSHEGFFDPNNVPIQMEGYLQDFVARIQYGIENHIEADEATARQWELVKATGRLNESKSTKAVEPLLTEMWEQGCLYNNLCPSMEHTPCGHAEVGCVAVAMGQIMHYWRYPSTGWGSHSYNNSGFQLSADFGNTIYDWDHMPDSLTEDSSEAEIEAIATLLFHCGVSVDMKYTTNGSGADSGDVPDALIRYFNYSRRLHIEKRSDFDDEEWMSMLKACLDFQRPIFYGGKGEQGSHAFVCDGYDDNDLLHFNWGWGRANGYFALGHLNPIGISFNENNFAILDINPEYEPWIVHATPYPPTAGTIVGNGEYHIGEQCTLTATPVENSKFGYWKKDGKVVSYDRSYSFLITNDVEDIEAYFSYKPVKEIMTYHAPDTNDVNSPYVGLSWSYDTIYESNLLKQFEINGKSDLITTDGEHIYTAYKYGQPFIFGKYTMDGELVELFNIDGAKPDGLTTDGTYFYCTKNTASYDVYRLYCYDFNSKTLIDSTFMMNRQIYECAYDINYDAFWLKDHPQTTSSAITLVDRQGQSICSIKLPLYDDINGFGAVIAEDGNPHMLLLSNHSLIDYDISNSNFNNLSLFLDIPGSPVSSTFGKYEGKDAVFVIGSSYDYNFNDLYSIYIYEINCHLSPIRHYRIHRKDSEGHSVMLADEVTATSFIDSTWNEANAGTYRFGISEVYFNGVESEIIWSDPIVKTDIGLPENENDLLPDPSVQKVIEDGKIVIIKDGKRYSVSGQHLN